MPIEMDTMTTMGRSIERVIMVSFLWPLGGMSVGFICVGFGSVGVGVGFGVGI